MDLIKIKTDEKGEQLISARELYKFLESKQDFTDWIKKRIQKYDFVENEDYLLHKFMVQLPNGAKEKHDYILKIDVAKELAMVEGNEKGKQARKYFIEVEKKFKEIAPKTLIKGETILALENLMKDSMKKADETLENVEKIMDKGLIQLEDKVINEIKKIIDERFDKRIEAIVDTKLKIMVEKQCQERFEVYVNKLERYMEVIESDEVLEDIGKLKRNQQKVIKNMTPLVDTVERIEKIVNKITEIIKV